MKVTGFTFIRNAIKYDYPILAAINSILPICDEFIVAVGNSDDATLSLIQSLQSPKIKIIETVWDDSQREGGKVLAIETDKAFAEISENSDWAFYIQGDEAVHEQYLPAIKKGMKDYCENDEIDGLLFDYSHFYGSYDYVGESSSWYRNEIRIVKNKKNIYSYRDAQGFRKDDNQKLNVKKIDAQIYHYGWVRPPKVMQDKMHNFSKMWHSDEVAEEHFAAANDFDYSEIDILSKFKGTHPKVLQERIAKQNWSFDYDLSQNKLKFKDKLKFFIEKLTGHRFGEYKNYKVV